MVLPKNMIFSLRAELDAKSGQAMMIWFGLRKICHGSIFVGYFKKKGSHALDAHKFLSNKSIVEQ